MKIIGTLLLMAAALLFQGCATIAQSKNDGGSSNGSTAYVVKVAKINGEIVVTPMDPSVAALDKGDETVIKEFVEDFKLLDKTPSVTLQVTKNGDDVKFKRLDGKIAAPQ
ncbi:MAG TPA: hypothetical protein VFB27_04080 [Opitutaceae bacterium]|nr:hypothetical protein [Opitutaceae bacterium]